MPYNSIGGKFHEKDQIAQIGTSQNSHGNPIWHSLTKQKEIFEVVGYAMPEQEKEKFPSRMPDFAGYPELSVDAILRDPEIEAVAVETEEIYLTQYALLAARHGKHIHMKSRAEQSIPPSKCCWTKRGKTIWFSIRDICTATIHMYRSFCGKSGAENWEKSSAWKRK